MTILIANARVVTLRGGAGVRRGSTMGELGVIAHGWVRVEGDRIAGVGSGDAGTRAERVIDARGRVVMPGFVDCHTHACWAGDRIDEWRMRLSGTGYQEILVRGGGLLSTVRAVRSASEESLAGLLRERLDHMLREGTTTVEVKSGYGLSTEHELKMLRAIGRAARDWAGTVVPTACLGHAIDPGAAREEFVARTIGETLGAVSGEFPGIGVDAYCERGAWTLEECQRLFERARALGHPCRVHAEQFSRLGMTAWAASHGFRSVDHLEAAGEAERAVLAGSETIGVVLPASGFHLGTGYADARALIDAGAGVALATNMNPGSAPTGSMGMSMALGVRCCGFTAEEAITASCVNGAAVLGLGDRGRIEVGLRADLVVLRHSDERELAHSFGGSVTALVIAGGVVVDVGAL